MTVADHFEIDSSPTLRTGESVKLMRVWLHDQEFMIEKPDKIHCNSRFMTCPCLFSHSGSSAPARLDKYSLGYITLVSQTVTFVTDVANVCHRSGTRGERATCVFPTLSSSVRRSPPQPPRPLEQNQRAAQGDPLPFRLFPASFSCTSQPCMCTSPHSPRPPPKKSLMTTRQARGDKRIRVRSTTLILGGDSPRGAAAAYELL